ncbi:hypothetical protein [Vibrio campbellii]|uniref:hypothetical protein n=1 Tax=Vibrio campbellii TaxID=680 RepID=UPI00210C3C63|nr:hypothetical protein [Vibrio campbellii]UTZ44547.1 hypothetical protein HB764_25130 [Vibrio campbellii]
MKNQLLPYRPEHKLTVTFKAGGTSYHIVDTDYPIDNNAKLSPQLAKLCAEHANLPECVVSNIKVVDYKRYPKVKFPELENRTVLNGEYWLCEIEGFDIPRVFKREAGGWQIGQEITEAFMGNREIKPLARLYTQRDVYDLNMLYELSNRALKKLEAKLERVKKKAGRKTITDHLHAMLKGLVFNR